MASIYLHIGPHKTGSTYLQTLWMNNEDILLKHNIRYPRVFFMAFGQHHIVTHLKKRAFGEAFQKNLNILRSFKEDLILSSENYSLLTKEEFQILKEFLGFKEIKIVYYYRKPSLRFVSYWQESIKHGGFDNYFEYAHEHYLRPKASRELNPLLLLKDIESVFGKENIFIIDYEDAYKSNSMMKYFELVIGKGTIIPDKDKNVNAMAKLNEIEVLRQLNIRAEKNGTLRQSNMREAFNYCLANDIIDIEQISKRITEFNKEVILGNTLVDTFSNKEIISSYSENVVNNISSLIPKSYSIPTTNYLTMKTTKEIDEIYQTCSKYLFAQSRI